MALLDRAFAAVYDRIMRPVEEGEVGRTRAQLLAGLSGEVIDIGAGTGANLAHLPPTVTRTTMVEPSPDMARRLRERVRSYTGSTTVEVVEAPAESLPLADASVDHAITTLVLCTVDDPVAALAEIHRVLRPGGTLVVIEHVEAGGLPGRIQHAIEPVWTIAARGCKLTRDTRTLLDAGGFDVSAIVPMTWSGPRFATNGIAGIAPRRSDGG